ncbi:hypothetical protein ACFQ1I_28635 [Kitasatospora arboriphila]
MRCPSTPSATSTSASATASSPASARSPACCPRPSRNLALGIAAVLVGEQFLDGTDLVTGIGHPAALLIGIALWRPLRRGPRRPLRRRRPAPAPLPVRA